MNAPNDNHSQTPPFIFDDNVDPVKPISRVTDASSTQPFRVHEMSTQNNGYPSERGMLNVVIFLVSSLSMGIALLGGAWIGYGILENGVSNYPAAELVAGIFAAGLAYGVGWVVGLFGMRMLGNFLLPVTMKLYAWVVLVGLAVLQIAIISKLFKQAYSGEKFVFYVTLFCAGLAALIGIHLLIEDHKLSPFSFPILIISLCHLYLIVFHYIFVPSNKVKYEYLWGDMVFFLLTGTVSALMLAHFGILSGLRKDIDNKFSENTTRFVPPT